MNIIETRGLEHTYPDGTPALKGVDLSIKKGKKTAILGHNGAGKTTLLLHFNGILRPTGGEVLLEGKPIKYDRKSLVELRSMAGMVFQNPDDHLFAPTVARDVAFGPLNLGLSKEEVRRRVDEALEVVSMETFRDRPPHLLSDGQKKRAAIAGVLAMNPEILVFDEPLSNLDPSGMDDLLGLLEELNQKGKTIVVATHNVELAYQWADHVYLLKDGAVLEHGPPLEIFTRPSLLKRAGLRQPHILKVYSELKGRGLANGSPPKNLLELMDGLPKRMVKRNGVGKIYVTDPSGARELAPARVQYMGVLGTKAKLAAREMGLEADFYSDVVNNCILKAVAGFSCLIIASGGMVEKVRERVKGYNEESGLDIQVEILNREGEFQDE